MTQRVLFVSPYAAWSFHTVFETTLGHALRLRGATTHFLACDGLFPACDRFRAACATRNADSCRVCQATQAALFAEHATDYEWLGRYVPRHIYSQARAYVDSLPARDLLSTTWKGREVGRWARASTFTHHRTNALDYQDPRHRTAARDHVYGTIIAYEALSVAFDEIEPEVLVTLNGRFFVHWAAIEIAKERGIRVITHERGLRKNTLRLCDGVRTHELSELWDIWEAWKEVPLPEIALAYTERHLTDRRQGRNFSWNSFSPPPQPAEAFRAGLGLDERPIVAVFTSSSDESVAFETRRQGAFPDPADFLPGVVAVARARPGVQFVVRIHPNVASVVGVNRQEMTQAEEIAACGPDNLTVVMPQAEVSSYTLMDIAQVGVVYASTMGLEMACGGAPVVVAAQATWSHVGFAEQIEAPEALGSAVDRALARGRDPEIARMAMRWASHFFRHWAIPFPLVLEEPQHVGVRRWKDASDLAPGRSGVLDRFCKTVLEGGCVYLRPTKSDFARTAAAEDAWLKRAFSGEGASREPSEPEVKSADDWIGEGEERFSNGDIEGAAKCFVSACGVDAECAAAWNNLGVALHSLGQLKAAVEAMERSVALDPDSIDRVLNLARLLGIVGRGQEAIEWVTKAVANRPDEAQAWQLLRELAESA